VAVDRGALRPGDLAVWDGHVAMIVGNGTMIEPRCQLGVQNDRRHGIASAHFGAVMWAGRTLTPCRQPP
jgi:cell wall-associated NlpC family hydrolase